MKQWLLFLMMSIITSSICVESVLAQTTAAPEQTTTPIKHLIVVVGENHTFDDLFGGYQPRRGQAVSNLLSKGIINKDGSPGPNFDQAAQQIADNTGPAEYSLKPTHTGSFTTRPQPNTTYTTGLPQDVPDPRFPSDLPNGPSRSRSTSTSALMAATLHIGSSRCGSSSTTEPWTFSHG
jgi:hypothetical protein